MPYHQSGKKVNNEDRTVRRYMLLSNLLTYLRGWFPGLKPFKLTCYFKILFEWFKCLYG